MDEIHGRIFQEIVVEYPSISTYPECKGKPYFSIKYTENGQEFIGYGTYKPEVLSEYLKEYFMPSTQPENADCIYCHEDSDGYVTPIEKNCHAFIRFGMDGWEIRLRAKGWNGSAKIMYCPMCGRRLECG